MKQVVFLLLSTLFIGSFVACGSEEVHTPNPALTFRTEAKQNEQGDIIVPREGGTYRLRSLNYPSFYLQDFPFSIDRERVIERITIHEEEYEASAQWNWILAKVSGNILTVTLSPNTSGRPRHLGVYLRAHEKENIITFLQAGE